MVDFGDSLSGFLAQLGLWRSGGPRGSITTLRRQLDRLFRASVSWSYTGSGAALEQHIFPIESHAMWWDPKQPEQRDLFRSRIVLHQRFFEEIVRHPVPLDIRATFTRG